MATAGGPPEALNHIKGDGKVNPSNHLTKPISRDEMQREIARLGGEIIIKEKSSSRGEEQKMEKDVEVEQWIEQDGEDWELEDLYEALGLFVEEM